MHFHSKFKGSRCLFGSLRDAVCVQNTNTLSTSKINKLSFHVLSCVGGSISGAVFNPALAFSVQFPCSGHTYLEYCFVYWLGPVSGRQQKVR